MDPTRIQHHFRLSKEEIRRLVPLLGLEGVEWRAGRGGMRGVDPEKALCVLLARLSFPGRWSVCVDIFGRSRGWLSTVFNDTCLFLARRFDSLLEWHPQLRYRRMEAMAAAVKGQGGGDCIWGFVDGTFRGFCRPTGQEDQQYVYSGHKKAHGLQWQAIVTPDGLISSLIGPYRGAENDWEMWKDSGCEDRLRGVMAEEPGSPILYVYGDPAYHEAYGVLCPWKDRRGRRWLAPEMRAFNRRLSSVRIAVENAFGQVQQSWTYTAYSKALKMKWQPLGTYFLVAALLTNCLTCLRGNSISSRFGLPPPSVEVYLQ